jgi:heme exporter protein D
MMEFFEMGGYAVYVWSAFGLTTLVLVANVIFARHLLKRTKLQITGQIRREKRIGTTNK